MGIEQWTMRRQVGDDCSLARQGRELPCRCRLGAGEVQEHVQMRLDGQGQDRGRTGQGPGRVARLPGEPPSRSQECAINQLAEPPWFRRILAVVAIVTSTALLCFTLFFPSLFSAPCQLSLARQAVELGKNVRGSFKMRSTRAEELWSRARMTECLHARSYRTAVVYRGQTRVWGKSERGARRMGAR